MGGSIQMKFLHVVFMVCLLPLTGLAQADSSGNAASSAGALPGPAPVQPMPLVFPVLTDNEGREYYNRAITLSPDGAEAYWPVIDVADGYRRWIVTSKLIDGRWTPPTLAPFSRKGLGDDVPVIAPGGDTVFFNSWRPIEEGRKPEKENIWFATRRGNGWSEPEPLPGAVNASCELHQLVSVDEASNLYFGGACGDEFGELDIYRSDYVDGTYQDPVNLGPAINTQGAEYGAFIAPDGSYLIFTKNLEDGWTLVISNRDDDGWTLPVDLRDIFTGFRGKNLGGGIVSHDGERLIFFAEGETSAIPYVVDASFIETLR